MRIIDLSHEIHNDMPVYPGDTRTILEHVRHLEGLKIFLCMGSRYATSGKKFSKRNN